MALRSETQRDFLQGLGACRGSTGAPGVSELKDWASQEKVAMGLLMGKERD